ncbi:MAG: ABC transporter transmembrane domain-containing protein [Wigglesworthia glossinidia]|nr:ABC transporter transmembrane domain-containing protein [Wigglesworthia glossinidia]
MRLFLKLSWFFRREWKKYILSILLLIFISILKLISPWMVGIIVDNVVNLRSTIQSLLILIAGIIASSILVYYLRYIWRIILFSSAYQLALDLRDQFYIILSKQKPHFYSKNKTGDLITRAVHDVDKVVYAVGEGVLALVDSLVLGCSVIIIMSIKINIYLTFFALFPMPLMVLCINNFGKKLYRSFCISQNAFSKLNNIIHENLKNIRITKSFGSEKYQLTYFITFIAKLHRKNIHSSKIDAKFDPIIYFFIGLSNLLAVAGGIYLIHKNIITIGELTSFIMYLGLMIWPMLAFAWTFNIVERGNVAYNRIYAYLNLEPFKNGNLPVPGHQGNILISIDKFSYPDSNQVVLKNIKINIKPKSYIGLCGPTGSGKSTLISLILRNLDLYKGKILFHNLPLSSLNLNEWRSLISFVDQVPFLFSDSIKNNICLGNPKATLNQIEYVAKLACIHQDIINFPKNYHTKVGEQGIMLSGGQKQRIAIARALLFPSKILILDDAFSSVDNYIGHNILTNIKKLKHYYILIISTHKLSFLKESSEIFVLQHGKIKQHGSHHVLIKQQGWYSKIYQYQKFKYNPSSKED